MKITKLQIVFFLAFIQTISYSQCWKSVSVGYSHNIAIANNGELWAWGLNHFGQLGDGTQIVKNTPIRIGTDADWKLISAGNGPRSFNLAIKTNGTLWAWGNNTNGQVGDGTFVHKFAPVQVSTDTNWKEIATGYSHAMAIKTDGTLWTWGNSDYFALGYGTGFGQPLDKNIPTQLGTDKTWKSVAAGDRYSLALKTDGTVWGWGYNTANQININGSGVYVMSPQQRSSNGTGVRAISAGGSHSYDVKSNTNLLVTWGSNSYGEGGGTSCAGCPSYFVTAFDCGDDTAAIIKTDGTLWYTGKKLGYTANTVQYTSEFLQLGTDKNWKSVSVGNQSAAAINSDGSIWTWGWNNYGQLGNGSTTNSLSMVSVACPSTLKTDLFVKSSKNIIYPNPVNAILKIQINDQSSIDKILISDILGKTVLKRFSAQSELDVSDLKKGVYFIKIYTDKGITTSKFNKD